MITKKQSSIDNYGDLIYKSLKLLAQALYPYIEERMREYYLDNWLKEAKNILKNQQGLNKRNLDEALRKDVSLQLKLIYKLWDNIFKYDLSQGTEMSKSKVKKLLDIRNNCAHFFPFPKKKVDIALDSIIQLLKTINAAEVENVEKIKNRKY
ncbi:Swt1 family HEPN domain-containing protein [Okeania sp. SIO2B3]|uniref:Swt1 family HEPN domain-containing protein n=1 Tax=Okeania sp. SIO2B3 TaxID=2607784 RepID=UPI0013C15DDD|nr:Swt1 family HEPN domain-containing protein [Okeania sp. SIO2B3]NET47004.1 hypothetical protein [Okeania sp. SIO2B3]